MMSTSDWLKGIAAGVFALGLMASHCLAETIEPYKDDLFGYPGILSSEDDGDFRTVDYEELRDINKRDEEPERRVRGRYVTLSVRRHQAMETLTIDGRAIDVFRAGDLATAKFAVIFLHGRGGDRRLGANDFSFGGNFNRLKNLAVDNGGVYFAPSVKDFDANGLADLQALVAGIAAQTSGAKIILSCASMGSILCWSAANNPTIASHLSGMMVMGGVSDGTFLKSPLAARKVPVFFSHGSHDSVYPAETQVGLYHALHKSGYPVRFVLFETGSHGTPVRMTDWRDSINWILSHPGKG